MSRKAASEAGKHEIVLSCYGIHVGRKGAGSHHVSPDGYTHRASAVGLCGSKSTEKILPQWKLLLLVCVPQHPQLQKWRILFTWKYSLCDFIYV